MPKPSETQQAACRTSSFANSQTYWLGFSTCTCSRATHEQLPNDDEFFICTETTVSIDVEIFLRRALDSHQAKIYSIVNVHELTYDNSVRIFQLYVELPKSPAFNLCVFCSQEQEDKYVFVTAFDRYRINVPKQLDLKALQAYLTDHLSNQQGKAMTASLVEKDKLTTRVIRSERTAVGKSLYISRLFDDLRSNINANAKYCCISVKTQKLNNDEIFEKFKTFDSVNHSMPRIFHVDIAYEVWHFVDWLLFELLVLDKSMRELNFFSGIGLEKVIIFKEEKSWWSWGAFAVAMIETLTPGRNSSILPTS
jgi:hypothetical protein